MLNISALQANPDHLMRTGFAAIPMTTDLPSANPHRRRPGRDGSHQQSSVRGSGSPFG
jgi:hypothetical protein